MKNIVKQNYLENKYVEIWVEEGIIYEVFKPGAVINLQAAQKVVADRLKVSNKTTMPLFVDMRQLLSIDKESRQYMARGEAIHYLSAGAFLVKNTISRLIFNSFLILSQPPIPTKGFTDEEKALSWLKYFKNVN